MKRHLHSSRAVLPFGFSFFLILWIWATDLSAENYLVSDLGTLGGNSSGALAINNSGNVAGYAGATSGGIHAVVLTNDVLADLGTLGGSNSVATALNASNQAAGWANPPGSQAKRAFIASQGIMTDLGALLADSTNSLAHGINKLGTVVGEYETADGQQRPFVFANVIIPLGFEGAANCITDAGQIGGFEINGGKLGFILSGAQRKYVGTLGSNDTEVIQINTNGLAVGRSLTLQGTFHGFGYESGVLRDLGTLGGSSSEAYGVNSAGHIVGQSEDEHGTLRAFLYRGGTMLDLNQLLPADSGWFLTVANAINDTGQIVGLGQFKGQTHGYVLTPNFLDLALYPGLVIAGKVGRNYRIDYLDAINPTNTWQSLTNFTLAASPYFFIDPRPVVFSNRIYRSVLLPSN